MVEAIRHAITLIDEGATLAQFREIVARRVEAVGGIHEEYRVRHADVDSECHALDAKVIRETELPKNGDPLPFDPYWRKRADFLERELVQVRQILGSHV